MNVKEIARELQFCMSQDTHRNIPCATMFYNIETNLRNYGNYLKRKKGTNLI